MKSNYWQSLIDILVIAVACIACASANAEIHYISGSVDVFEGYTKDVDTYGPIVPSEVTLSVGDTVHLSYVFKDGRKLRLKDSEDGASSFTRTSPWVGFVGTTCGEITECGDFTVSDWSIELIGAQSKSGSAPESFSGLNQGSCCNHLGTDGNFYLEDGDYIEFSGIKTSFTIDSLPANPNSYNAIRTRYYADEIAVIAPTYADIDIAPNKGLRCKNQRKVVIHGGVDLDVSAIDSTTLRFGEMDSDARAPVCKIDYLNDDIYLDLLCKFIPGTSSAVLGGELTDGSSIRGVDHICAAQ